MSRGDVRYPAIGTPYYRINESGTSVRMRTIESSLPYKYEFYNNSLGKKLAKVIGQNAALTAH